MILGSNASDATSLRISAAGGVTGGHLYPNLAVLEEFAGRLNTEVLYFCVEGKLEEKLLPVFHPEYKRVSLRVQGLLRPIYHPANVIRILRIISNEGKIKANLKSFRPDFSYVSGGYVSYPVALASKRLGVPVFVQEQNTIPGKSNVAISRFAERIFVAFEESITHFPPEVRNRIVITGNPIWVREGKVELAHPTVLIVGGSGGSEFLNALALELAKRMPDVNFVLSTGGKSLDTADLPKNLEVKNYIDNMFAYWRAVDCAITRAGATTISELIHFNVPAIVIPWEGATEGHQVINAKIFEKTGLGKMIRESDASVDKVEWELRHLLLHGRVFSERENPAKKIVDEILRVISR
ncbi:UDP-N-acetylglucosamine--N-acetylmuramyl-(pentapeptide) pyrophosphoryl-undecaprenol N-acetylglucosamine transferase [Fervidobacterium thailandense]|uniref:UDP-N-acetylglucosamine--N-acetylmuramyl-(pentapeptide) pyrophosphoryl-undecaprenol N-acetylglucosamine transferase n=2 Tax=Fervidobacterium thailandense TaxID=1008305 RepID=A0A1E3G6A4_9BACT|nr:UDP-N-acetylglucosamine--N-acetylmuramyl-(pentapeptide) pyrophosphoryl-undecaprenol N-acetylglucosamine transferase [Fervidobacterium thailandense]